jgi:hypothetical protein
MASEAMPTMLTATKIQGFDWDFGRDRLCHSQNATLANGGKKMNANGQTNIH